MSKSRKTSGLDQLGPVRFDVDWTLRHRVHVHTANARAAMSAKRREVKITLSDHLFSSDEIKTKEDE